MKLTIKALFVAAFMMVGATVFAQNIGYVSYMELIEAMPEKAQADKQLEKYAQSLDQQRKEMEQEYSLKLAKLQGEADSLSEAVLQIRAKELQDLEARINAFGQAAQQDIVNKRESLYEPIITKVDDAIKEVAQENGLKYVLEENSVLYADENENITAAVRTKLGL